jgi:hypothetical protein
MLAEEVFVMCLLRRKGNMVLANKGNKTNVYGSKGSTRSGKSRVKGAQKEYKLASSLPYLLLVPSNQE